MPWSRHLCISVSLVHCHNSYGRLLPLKLRMRAKNRSFNECPTCQRFRLAYREALRARDRTTMLDVYKQMKEHAQWFLGQRVELDILRKSGARQDILFEQ
eukprot:scaffold210125_cov33-Tisochrysis_lutea.AAC.3